MKNLFSVILILTSVIFSAACQQSAVTNTNTAKTNQVVAVNSNGNQTTAGHSETNHTAMNHSTMASSPGAATAVYDLQFLDTMTAHHQGAVDMAKMAETKASRKELKEFSAKIITDQNKEIAGMKTWREKWFAGKPVAVNMEMAGMADSMRGMEMSKLDAATGESFDLLFVEMMIPHHEGAIVMAREALAKSEHAEIKQLANEIIQAQEAEIKQMQTWKTIWSKAK